MTTAEEDLADRLGLRPGQIVQEIGWDEDSDHDLREAAAARTGADLVDEEYTVAVVDVVLLWLRDGDGDIVDALTKAMSSLADPGYIWLLTPKAGRGVYVRQSDIGEAAASAGLARMRCVSVSGDWYGTRLVRKRTRRVLGR